MNRARTFLAICALALPATLLAAGCGGDGSDEDPRAVVDRTFATETEISSGNLDLSLDVAVMGEQSGNLAVELGGLFAGDPADTGELPQLDMSGSVSGAGMGESVDESGRVILTSDNAYLEYDGETYEAGQEMFAQLSEGYRSEAGAGAELGFREACSQAVTEAGGDPATCDVDIASDWLTNLENEGTEDVEGTETIHVSGVLDVERMMADLVRMVESTGQGLQGIQPSQLAAAVPEASFDLYTGADDDLIRRLEMSMVIDPSAVLGAIIPSPVDQIDIDLSFTLSEVNEAVTIVAPEGPTQSLEQLFGGAGGLGLGGGVPGLGGGGFDDDFGDDDFGGGGRGGGAGDDGPDPRAEAYLECIQNAGGDPDAINACADEL